MKDSSEEVLDFFQGFSKLDREARLHRLFKFGALDTEDLRLLSKKDLFSFSLAEKLIENVIGYFQMPLGVVPHFVIDGRAYVVPMAIEETSIIAAASKTAKWIKNKGEIRTQILGRNSTGQMQVSRVKDFPFFSRVLKREKKNLIFDVNKNVAYGLVKRGGGVKDFEIRKLPREDDQGKSHQGKNCQRKGRKECMAIIHVFVDCCDAMGANIVNQICEYLRDPIQKLTGEKVSICILSNLSDQRLVRAEVLLKDLEAQFVEKIEEASLFSLHDPYRACTHNKGVLNAIDALLIATGNDWRAVEAGVHAYAAVKGKGSYEPITMWREWENSSRESQEGERRNCERGKKESEENKKSQRSVKGGKKSLKGVFEAPLSVGVVGGVTGLHPMAALSLKMLKIKTSDELARICAAIGLVQNLGALIALTTVGIIEGHMKLHIKNLTLSAGAKEKEVFYVQKRLEETLASNRRVTLSQAVQVLKELRNARSL